MGTQMLAAAILGRSLYHKDIGAGKCHFGVLPLALVPGDSLPTRQSAPVLGHPQATQPATPRPGPIHLQLAGSKPGRAWQPTGPGTSLTYQCVHSSWLHHIRRAHAAHIGGAPRAHSSRDQNGVCCWTPIGHLLHKPTSPRSGNVTNLCNTYK